MIYADNAATTKISDLALEKMLPWLQEQYGNASSNHSFGARAKRAIEHARKQVAAAIGAKPDEITFTSSGSETNNWILRSIADIFHREVIHLITSSIEHHSILNICHELENGNIEITYLPVDNAGRVSVDDVKLAIKSNTKLVSIMLANNEVGTIQPIADIGRLLKDRGIIFHTDAVQAAGHIPINVDDLQVDLLTASAHKFNGPKGTGILYKRSDIKVCPAIFGGKQEHGLRAGTENVAGIVATGYAIEESISNMNQTANNAKTIVNETIIGIQSKIPVVKVNSNNKNGLPGIISLTFEDILGESIMHLLDLKGICISTGSACTSDKDEPSHVLLAMGLMEEQAKSSIRISYGRYNTIEDAKSIASAICDAYEKIKNSR